VLAAPVEEEAATRMWSEFRKLLPYRNKLTLVRWSGEAAWVPMGEFRLDVGFENHNSYTLRVTSFLPGRLQRDGNPV